MTMLPRALLASLLLVLTPATVALAPAAATAGTRPADTSCATTGSVDFGVDLAGAGWRFRTGDDPAWSDPAFVDTGWDAWSVPDNWGAGELSSYDGFAWYRRTFTLPERPAGVTDSAVVAALGKIDDADQAFLNGQEIGRTGGFPPAFDSTWEVPREYYPADGLLRWGATNVLAVRVYDGTGGGGFYQGPVGLFSKARLRTLGGITGTPAGKAQLAHACAILGKQHRAVAAGDLRAYAGTLADGFFHQGDTAARRLADLRAFPGRSTLRDSQAELFVDTQGRLVVDTIRSWTGADGTVLLPPTRELLYLDPRRDQELGDHSRFFRDSYESAAMGRRVQFNVYLPKGYTRTTAKRYPVVYLLNGFNGSNIEWEARDMDAVLDKLTRDADLEESVVVFPDGDSGWYVDTSVGNFRTMIVKEIVPLVDRAYRTIADREHRGVSGVSMGGQGAFTLGLTHPDVFSSIASHMGALSLAPLAGTPAEQAANASLQPIAVVTAASVADLRRHTYYFDGGDQDDYRFGAAAQRMSTALAAKGIRHDYQLGAGRHDDAYWMPKLDRSFGLHTEQFRAHPYRQAREPRAPRTAYVWP
ncbi:alpha/beta hydrolase-fold protein [Actinoplanes sp. NPDC049599]|uniref:alpha/beta hydrolase n=1 Tax=Actinoplanes sp. NPDC049599 TaxID=3363903 RepID=UPI0037BAC949